MVLRSDARRVVFVQVIDATTLIITSLPIKIRLVMLQLKTGLCFPTSILFLRQLTEL